MIRILREEEESGSSETNLGHSISSIFRQDGLLEKILGFEHRPEQSKMADQVLYSIENGEHLVFEAGTGVGKSLAYLLPSILLARQRKRPCVVATNTINLQEQILDKDIPAARKLLGEIPQLAKYGEFSSALLVGRANYLCSTRMNRALRGQAEIFDSFQREEIERISNWANHSAKEGIRQEISPPPSPSIWDLVNADSSICSAKRCRPDNCFYRKARAEVEGADLIIVNHSLLFSLLGSGFSPPDGAEGVVFSDDFLIFDEAHEMNDVASDHLGLSISSWAIETTLKRIFNPRKRKGLLQKVGRPKDFENLEDAYLAVSDFFQYLHVNSLGNDERKRLMVPNDLPMEILPPLSRVVRNLVEIAEICTDDSLKIELKDQSKRLQSYVLGLSEVIEMKDSNSVYWLERTGKKNQVIHLRSAPLNVSEILSELLFSRNSPVVMTSATLTRNGKADSFKALNGCKGVKEEIVNSPFDYEFNLCVRLFSDCPEPMAENRNPYLDYLVVAIDSLAQSIEGGTLALFTNYNDLLYCYHALQSKWQKKGRSVYAQGTDHSRSELRAKMMEEGDVLLLGAESFWKGFDAKGRCLSQVIITRLPFENPNHPIMEAKSELLKETGKNSFMELTLPSAVIKFRQGIGRLIRSKSDMGDLVVLDSRILSKQYGKHFLVELPKKKYEIMTMSDFLD